MLFKLDGPMGNFPYIVSSDNYNAIILPASVTDTTQFATANIPTSGPFMFDSYDPVQGVKFVPNPNYWGTPVNLEKVEFQFFEDVAATGHRVPGGRPRRHLAVLGLGWRVAARRSRSQRHRA